MVQLFARIALATGFILPVLDRTGGLGPAGSTNVAWGNWPNFVDYTHQLLPFLNSSFSVIAARIATICEIVLALGLLLGYKTKWMGLGSAILTALFGICMFVNLGPLSPFTYPVFLFTAAGLLLWKQSSFRWSIDQYLISKIQRQK